MLIQYSRTGEVRKPNRGEWFLDHNGQPVQAIYLAHQYRHAYAILKVRSYTVASPGTRVAWRILLYLAVGAVVGVLGGLLAYHGGRNDLFP